jgi:hypothetical protein
MHGVCACARTVHAWYSLYHSAHDAPHDFGVLPRCTYDRFQRGGIVAATKDALPFPHAHLHPLSYKLQFVLQDPYAPNRAQTHTTK